MKAMRQIVAVLALVMLAGSAQAGLSLTPDGVSRGFTLTTIASNFPFIPTLTGGPFGVFYSTSGLLVTDGADSSVRLFKKDCDGQDASTNRPTAFYAVGHEPLGMTEAHLHGKPKYYLITSPGEVFQINADGTPIQKVLTVPGNFKFADIAFDPHFGVLLATAPACGDDIDFSCGGIFSIDPVAKTSTEIAPNFSVTGVQVDASDNIFINFFFFGTIWFNPDFSIKSIFPLPEAESLVLGTGTLADHIFLWDHNGELWEQNLDGSDLTMIASGGELNPIATADPHNGSLVFTDHDKVVRLSGGGLASADGETQVNSCMDK